MPRPPRWTALVCALLVSASAAHACTFCSGGVTSRQTLREHLATAQYAAYGTLKNPRVEPNGVSGATDFHVVQVLKPHAPFAKMPAFVIPKYLPVIGNTPPEYLYFVGDREGKPDPVYGVPATLPMCEYVAAAMKLNPTDATARLAFSFGHLDSPDPSVAADAFLEFAKATDAEIAKAKAVLNPGRLRKLLTHSETPADRLGVYAMLLGLCGGPEDRDFFDKLVTARPLSPRVQDNLGGYLAGLTTLDAKLGWQRIAAVIDDAKRPYAERLSAIGTLRYFQASKGDAVRPEVVACYKALLRHADLADLAIEDLRRWGYFDLTPEVLALFSTPTHASRLVRRAIVQYALTAPGAEATAFVAGVRTSDAKLIATVEELMKLQDPAKK